MVNYYDLVLGAIPTALVGITLALTATGVETQAAIPVAAAVALGVMGHAMFVNAPGELRTTDRPTDSDTSSSTGVSPPNAD